MAELLSLVAEQGPRLRAAVRLADSTQGCFGGALRRGAPHPVCGAPPPVPIRAELTRTPATQDVVAEDLAAAPDSALTEPGVPRGLRRTGHLRTVHIPVYDRFVPSLLAQMPSGYLLGASQAAAVTLLRRHGVLVQRATAVAQVDVVPFTVDSVVRAARPFQGHREVQVVGRWAGASRRERVRPGTFVVRTDQPLGLLAMLLLEPQSDDGLATWNVFDRSLAPGREYPVLRLAGQPQLRGQPVR